MRPAPDRRARSGSAARCRAGRAARGNRAGRGTDIMLGGNREKEAERLMSEKEISKEEAYKEWEIDSVTLFLSKYPLMDSLLLKKLDILKKNNIKSLLLKFKPKIIFFFAGQSSPKNLFLKKEKHI